MSDHLRAAGPGDHMDAVLDAARAGGEWAWDLIYEDAAPSVLGYLRGRGVADPEDVLGEVFLQAVRSLDGFAGDYRGFRAWLLTIAHRRMVDEHRRRARRPAESIPDHDLEMRGPLGDVEEESLNRVRAGAVLAAIRALTPDQRDVLLLRLVADLSTEETGRVLGKRPEAVKALQRRGLAALHKKISPQPVSQ